MATGDGCSYDHFLGSVGAIAGMLCLMIFFVYFCLHIQRFLPELRRAHPSHSGTNAPTEGETRAAAAMTALPMRTIGIEAQAADASSVEAANASGHGSFAADECAICLSAVAEGQMLATLPCKHCFHTDCIRRWWATAKRQDHLTCPLCKQPTQLPDQAEAAPLATAAASERSNRVTSTPPEIEMDAEAPSRQRASHVDLGAR